MPVVPADQVTTEEVKAWQGVHLLYFDGSLCVRKVQLVLALKGIDYTKTRVSMQDLHTEWYLGINPRGLVPVLVHDGVVIIESNDILEHLEEAFPTTEPRLTPADLGEAQSVAEYLRTQDGYHMHIRTLTFKSMMPEPVMVQMAMSKVSQMDKEDAEMAIVDVVSAGGQGRADQRAFYEAVVANRGIPDAQVAASVARFREVLAGFDVDYKDRDYLVGGWEPDHGGCRHLGRLRTAAEGCAGRFCTSRRVCFARGGLSAPGLTGRPLIVVPYTGRPLILKMCLSV
jgi:glutathione S-transferase